MSQGIVEIGARDRQRDCSSTRTHSMLSTILLAVDSHGLRPPVEFDAVEFGEFVFVIEGGHFGFAAAVNHVDLLPRRGDARRWRHQSRCFRRR